MRHRLLLLSSVPVLLTGCASNPTTPPAPVREVLGASVPWTRYEAEDATSNVKPAAATRTYLTPASEASGRRYVELASPGNSVAFTITTPGNGLVVRYSIPDTTDGTGRDATLSLSINGAPQEKLRLTSRFTWVYGEFPWTNEPSAGSGHHFFDETQRILPLLQPGDVVRLEVGDGDTAGTYSIDFIEVEPVPAPLKQPSNSVSIVDFGAVPDDDLADTDAFLKCVDASKDKGAICWIPAGTFILNGQFKGLGSVHVRGAGMWHTKLTGSAPMFYGYGETFSVMDLSIHGGVTFRNDVSPDNAFFGNMGAGTRIERVWIEHMKCGVWSNNGTTNLLVKDCRIRNTMADGVNLCDGTVDSAVENTHLRNTGDDSLATWSPSGDWSSKVMCERNTFRGNTVENPWYANGIGIYGGRDHVVRGNLVHDTVKSGGGLLVSSSHGAMPFQGTLTVEDNRFVRTGGDCYVDGRNGGLWFHAHESDIDAPVIVRNLEILDSEQAGITIHGPAALRNAVFENVTIRGPQERGIHTMPGAGEVNVTVRNLRLVRSATLPPD